MTNLKLANGRSRGVSSVIGFMMIFVIVSLMLGYYQATIVPSLNEQAEVDANQNLQTQSLELNSKISSALASDTPLTQPLGMKVEYVGFQLGKPKVGWVLNKSESASYSITDTRNTSYSNETTTFTVSANYVESQRMADFHYEHGLTIRQTADGTYVPLSNQPVIHNDRLYLYRLDAVSTTSSTSPLMVQIYPQEPMQKVDTITNSSGETITVTIPTQLPKSTWSQLLNDERTTNGGHITSLSYTEQTDGLNTLSFELEQGVTYSVYRGTADLNMQ